MLDVREIKEEMELSEEAEQAIVALHTMRIGNSRVEKEAVDYAVESIHIRCRLENFFKERGVE